ncbi:hexokinase type 2 isoform X2 [Eurytemora carolleeae]|uniref:hexokinase type 2 isoform X2 n=1 Tax=Eurytemora carolleeae TaxID=1294199 RepID=UPI000C775B3B|nr:hexokinase type 2 isoform X2 [Eurytemora carolleeae]|eukprot:XP_023321615.1 hexokinase type 2-like isoform X2 [Eurytemora affinis]
MGLLAYFKKPGEMVLITNERMNEMMEERMDTERTDERLDTISSLQGEKKCNNETTGRKGSAGNKWSIRRESVPGEGRVRCTSISMKTYKPHLICETRRKVEDLCRDLVVNNDHIHLVEMRLRDSISKGLDKEHHDQSSVKCYPTYVRKLPTGREKGRFLALDLGGTNFRVLLINISEGYFLMESEIYSISEELMLGKGDNLFDHIASCLAGFIVQYNLGDLTLPLGFTFSFPLIQDGLAQGRLAQWTKGFKCAGVEGEDVVHLLKEAISRRGDLKIDVCAILNDTTGTLMSCGWKEPKCRIGLILGTGTNACYLEKESKVGTLNHDPEQGSGSDIIINTEWGAFGDYGELDFIRTKWDEEIDEQSLNPGKQIFEKMISGMYMGELVRLVLEDMIEEGLIFTNQDTSVLSQKGAFPTRFLSQIEADAVGHYDRGREVVGELGLSDVCEADLSALRYICECVSRRAGFMCAAGLTALIKKMDYKEVVVAVDGSLFRYHPHFRNVMKSRVAQLMGIDYKFDIMMSEDGSGRGAALVAAVLKGGDIQPEPVNQKGDLCSIM